MSQNLEVIDGADLPVMPGGDRALNGVHLFGYRTDTNETINFKGEEILKEVDDAVAGSTGYPIFAAEHPAFHTGDKVTKDGQLYKFTDELAANAAWDSTKVELWSIDEELEGKVDPSTVYTKAEVDALLATKLTKGEYDASTAVGLADNIRGDVYADEQFSLRMTGRSAPSITSKF